ncbi:TRAP transporter substrate-binding protein [Pseudogulbenkiania subflava]|uniref:C4-dicarboxylate-binding protein DctP n=1 Tax=Pseudogulbenkiania subflava DSM 22618 TaxID=1123014 RepID=A0A1Y6BS46_9NEIS|nr:TRAP transporter substrate-binding protein [Pseudogulbenkiania subflava]SMF26518.1 C4-dicarboxylate-binding protein DctP [Pseudogulbenkiania subflava DSM 22618]
MFKTTIISAALGVVFLSVNAQAAEPIIIKFSHVVTSNTPKGQAAERFKQLAEKYTGNRVKVELYPNSQLYKDKEELEALQLGAVQMLAPTVSKFGPVGVKEFEVFDVPYLFPDKVALRKVTDGPVGKKLLAKLEPKGIKGLAYWDNGFKIMTANKPIVKPDDMKGLKMRIQSSKVLEAQMRALGTIPQVMAFSEVYQALQTGVVDGTENTPSNVYTQKTHEVQRDMTLTNHGYIGYVVIANKKFWDGLPPDIRTKLDQALKEATVLNNDVAQKDNDNAIAAMKASGKVTFHTPTPQERQLWMAKLKPVEKEVAPRVGAGLIQEIHQAIGQK